MVNEANAGFWKRYPFEFYVAHGMLLGLVMGVVLGVVHNFFW